MPEWKEAVERCLFTDHLDEELKAFLNRQKPMSNDQDRWEFLFQNAYIWKRNCLVDFERIIMPSFFGQWDINTYWGTFSVPDHSLNTLEESLYWTLLTVWVLFMEYDTKKKYDSRGNRAPSLPLAGLAYLLRHQFQYPQAACAWLDKQQFLDEIENIYQQSREELRCVQAHPNNHNPEWIRAAESCCSKFLDHYRFYKEHLRDPAIVRLNEFEPDEYVRYLIWEGDTMYFLQLSDFG